MSFLQAIISGILQGLTEFLPISSSGHLVILHRLIGFEQSQLSFDIFLHLGTLLAIFLVLWKDFIEILKTNRRMIFYIILASFATACWALLFGRKAEAIFTNVKFVGLMLIVTGVWLILGNILRFGSEGFSGMKAFLIGLAQGIATLPGVSRSGATISTALFLGIDGKTAARFSFLLAIPAIIGTFLFKLKEVPFSGYNGYYFVGFISACITGIFSLKLLLSMLYRNKFHVFGIYCIVLGVLVAVFLK